MKRRQKMDNMHEKFADFWNICQHGQTCSVHEAAKIVSETFANLKEWSQSVLIHGSDRVTFQATTRCCINVGKAYTNKVITKEEAERLLLENLHLFYNHYTKEDVIENQELEYFQAQAKKQEKEKEMQAFHKKFNNTIQTSKNLESAEALSNNLENQMNNLTKQELISMIKQIQITCAMYK